MSARDRNREGGMILINVLLFVAIASGIVAVMLAGEDGAIARSTRMRDAAAAQAAARGGEMSAIVALRRDAVVAPEIDHPGEPWGALAEHHARIQDGTFDLAIADAQGRFNINTLMKPDVASSYVASRIAASLGLPPDMAARAAELVKRIGPLTDLAPLRLFDMNPATLARLQTLVTAMPGTAPINVNAAGEDLLGILLENPDMARRLVARRTQQGYLDPRDFATLGIAIPPGAGFTSDLYWVRTRVTIGDTPQQMTTLLQRRRAGGFVTVVPIARWRGASAPEQAPALDP